MPRTGGQLNTRSLLGGALLGQKKYAEAEPLLRSGYEGMKLGRPPRSRADRPRLAEALDRLIAAGEAAGTSPTRPRRGRTSGRSSPPRPRSRSRSTP